MVRAITFLLNILLFLGCNKNVAFLTIQDRTYFNGTVNSKAWEGDGITFFREDSTLHIRGFLGQAGFYHSINIVLKNRNPGTYLLDSSVQSASVSEVIGMDVIGATFKPQPQDSSYITVKYDNNWKHVSGDIKFLGFHHRHDRSISVVSTFYLEIGKKGQIWTCDFNTDGIRNCRFIE